MTEKEREIYEKGCRERMNEISKIIEITAGLLEELKPNTMEASLFFHGVMSAGVHWKIRKSKKHLSKESGLN